MIMKSQLDTYIEGANLVSNFRWDHSPGPAIEADCSRSNWRILLVEDPQEVRSDLNVALVSEGVAVIKAVSGSRAIELAKVTRIDLLLIDLNMAVKTGWEIFYEFTREHPMIPIMVLTARSNQHFTAVSVGVASLVEIPLDKPALLRTIENVIQEPLELRLSRLAGRMFWLNLNVPAVDGDLLADNRFQSTCG